MIQNKNLRRKGRDLHVTANFSGTAHHHTTASGTVRVSRHGLGGWGNYDTVNEVAPYWGMTTGSLLAYLESEGYDCYAASVGPISSAWDRACELYAQLTGTTVDYGAAHSAAHNHDRYGKTYAQPLWPQLWRSYGAAFHTDRM